MSVSPRPGAALSNLPEMYREMVLVRELSSRAVALQRQGRIGSWLGSEGQEAAMVGSAHALEPFDWVFASYREHAVPLVRGVPVVALFNHLFANVDDNARGRNLPPEYTFREVNFVSVSAPVGNQALQAVGAATAAQIRGDRTVVMTYFGDGTASQGDVHTAMVFAAQLKAPVVFFCQNNGWAISVPTARQSAVPLVERAAAVGLKGIQVDGNDAQEVLDATRAAVDRARSGAGPTFIVAMTYRLGAHSTSDDPSKYRDAAELARAEARDPLRIARAQLGLSDSEDEAIRAEARRAIAEAVAQAERVPRPQAIELCDGVYAEMPWHLRLEQQEL